MEQNTWNYLHPGDSIKVLGSSLGHCKFCLILCMKSDQLLVMSLGFVQQKTLEQKEGKRK